MLVNNNLPVCSGAIPSSKDIPDLRDCFYIFEKIVKLPKKLLTLGPNIQKFEELQRRVTAKTEDKNCDKMVSVISTAVAVTCVVLFLGCMAHVGDPKMTTAWKVACISGVILLGIISPFAIIFAVVFSSFYLHNSFRLNVDQQCSYNQRQLVHDHLVKIRNYFAQEGGDKLNELITQSISTEKKNLEEREIEAPPQLHSGTPASIQTQIDQRTVAVDLFKKTQRQIERYDVALKQWKIIKKLFCDVDKPSEHLIPTYIPNNSKN